MKKVSLLLFSGIILVPLGISYFYISSRIHLIQDEYIHYDQIFRFLRFEKELNPGLMTYPGYHFILANIAKPLDFSEAEEVRLLAFVINILVIPLFYITARTLEEKTAKVKTLLFTFLPILFPFFPMIYTDMLSMICILLAFFFIVRKRYWLSGTFATVSIFIRQNNILWVVFLNAILYLKDYGFSIDRKKISLLIVRSFTFFLGIVIFLFGIWVTKGVVVSEYAKSYIHLSWSLANNVYIALFLYGFLFLPEVLFRIKDVLRLVRKKPWVLAIIVGFFPIFLLSFVNDHPFNQAPWFLHNLVLLVFTQTLVYKIAMYAIISVSFLTIATTRLRERYYYLFYPFTILYLLPYWLVDVRYSFIPFMFFLLFREERGGKMVTATVLYFLFWCFVFVYGTGKFWFFL